VKYNSPTGKTSLNQLLGVHISASGIQVHHEMVANFHLPSFLPAGLLGGSAANEKNFYSAFSASALNTTFNILALHV
jgi:hypothetical protein